MTAIIGILNKATVAIAADSAATVSNGAVAKVYNHAHKIFNLCKDAPIAISIYNSAEFMGIPWETIIKIYRGDGGTNQMPDLFEHGPHFMEFLNRFIHKISDDDEKQAVAQIALSLAARMWNIFVLYVDTYNFVSKTREERSSEFNAVVMQNVLPFMQQQINKADVLDSFVDYAKDKFTSVFTTTVEQTVTQYLEETAIDLNEQILEGFIDLVYEASRRNELYESYTGVVFAGFGTDDLFPKLISYRVGGVVDKKIRYILDEDSIEINNTTHSAIKPFAQTDIIESFIYGIDPNVSNALPELFSQTLDEIAAKMLKKLPKDQAALKKTIEDVKTVMLEELSNKFSEKLTKQCVDNNYFPILSTIGTLSKEDLAEMAESLINLTYLKRRVTFAEESVGGPVDIAIITKGDGFVWIKRKHYFKPETNLNYLASVLKK